MRWLQHMNKAAALPSINRLFRSRLQIRYKNGLLSLVRFSSVQFGSVRIVSYRFVSLVLHRFFRFWLFFTKCLLYGNVFTSLSVHSSVSLSLSLCPFPPLFGVRLSSGLLTYLWPSERIITHKFVVRLMTPQQGRA